MGSIHYSAWGWGVASSSLRTVVDPEWATNGNKQEAEEMADRSRPVSPPHAPHQSTSTDNTRPDSINPQSPAGQHVRATTVVPLAKGEGAANEC